MTRCANEREYSGTGYDWSPPADLSEIRVETPRLIVRSYELADATEMFETLTTFRDELSRWMDWVTDHKCVDNTYDYVIRQRLALRDLRASRAVGLGIFMRESGQFLGGTGFHGLHLDSANAEMGYWVRDDMTGKGYCTEAARHLVSYLLRPQNQGGLGLQRVRAFCSSENLASRRVLEKLGLPVEITQRNDYFVKGLGRVTGRFGYGVMCDEWDCDHHRPIDGTPKNRFTPA